MSVNYIKLLDAPARLSEVHAPKEARTILQHEIESEAPDTGAPRMPTFFQDDATGAITPIRASAWRSNDGRFIRNWATGKTTGDARALNVSIDPYSTNLRRITGIILILKSSIAALIVPGDPSIAEGPHTHSRMPGRPTAKHLHLKELDRRYQETPPNIEATLPAQAEALLLWMKAEYPKFNPGAIGTIKNNIRVPFRQMKAGEYPPPAH